MNRLGSGAVALVMAWLLVTPAAAQDALVLRDPVIVDGRGGAPITGQSVLIRGGRIVAIGPVDRLDAQGARNIDLRGKYLLPGLIDTHLHSPPDSAAVAARMAWLFRNGITTARDMAADA
ncbi:MAG: amidohydrolase family protein, partial [Gemmatimonadales bacterium]